MTSLDHTGNLVGALALVITDRTSDAIAEAGQSSTAAAALSALHQFLDRPTIDQLRQVLGLTHSGTVRLVDRLEKNGHLRRYPGADGRSTALSLTASGRRQAAKLAETRARVIENALGVLSPTELNTLDQLVGRILVGLMRGPGATRWMCRLCDLGACGRANGACPVERAAAAKYLGAEPKDTP